MTSTTIDQDGRATIASAEGQAALAAGDTQRARDRHAEAGAILEREAAQEPGGENEHVALFLAATQYYKGGHYQKALAVAQKVKKSLLPESFSRLWDGFWQDAKARAAPDYNNQVLKLLNVQRAAQNYAGIIETLQEHPYILPPASLAFNRAVCCEQLKKYRSAAFFFADAARWAPDDPDALLALAHLPLTWAGQGRLQEAWEYVQIQLELFPNAVSYAVASLLCYHRVHQTEDVDRKESLCREQVQYFNRAREEHARLPSALQSSSEIKTVLGLGYEAAAFALYQSGDEKAAREMGNAAIAFDPTSPKVWTLWGVITSAGPEAERAFRKAIDLGDQRYFPYYYLAYDALKRKEHREALEWARQALEKGERQDNEVKSLLYQWSAISLVHLGAAREEIETFLRKAVEVAPDNELARENYRSFRDKHIPTPPPLAPRQILLYPRMERQGEWKLAAVAG